MGCGGSKLEVDQEATLRPIRRRIEELLSRRNAGVSKKQPLLGDGADSRGSEGGEEEEEIIIKEDGTPRLPSTSDDGHSSLLTQDIPPIPQQIISPIDNNNSSSISFPKEEGKNDDNNNVKNDDSNDNIVGEEKCHKIGDNDEGKNVHDKEIIKGSSQVEEEECTCEDLGRMVYSAGSPSFRVYCVHDSLDEEELNEIAGHDFESSEDCIMVDDKKCLRQESSSSNTEEVDQAKHSLKKHKRGRKFKMIAIPKGGKNILHNMHALYHFPCHSHNSHHLMQQAAA